MASTIGILRKLNKLIFYLSISTWFNPLNFKSEREKFLKSKTYEPQFVYPEFNLKKLSGYRAIVNELHDFLKNSSFDRNHQAILREKTKEAKLYLELLQARGKPELSGISAELYQCTFEKKIKDSAKKDSRIRFLANKEIIENRLLVKTIKNSLLEYKTKDWQVITSSESGFNCRIFPEKKLIVVNEKIDWDFFTLDGFIAHEIDGHVLRTINSQNQKDIFYKFQLPFYIKTEEGLASYLADYCSDNKFGKTYHALKYSACILALDESFRKVYDFFLENNFSSLLAFLASFRIKRGFENASIPGFFAREAMYYEGMQEVKAYIENGGDVTLLFAAKAGLADINRLSSDNVVVPLRIKPNH